MAAGLTGDTSSLRAFAQRLRGLPRELAIKVAKDAAPALTAVARQTFDAGEDAFGVPWTPREDGKRATLVKSGTMAAKIAYVAIGTIIRVALGVSYAKYQVGRRPIFPRQNEQLPASYVAVLEQKTQAAALSILGVTS